ncbi:hypothetical protein D1872_270680 [compost metagenome]
MILYIVGLNTQPFVLIGRQLVHRLEPRLLHELERSELVHEQIIGIEALIWREHGHEYPILVMRQRVDPFGNIIGAAIEGILVIAALQKRGDATVELQMIGNAEQTLYGVLKLQLDELERFGGIRHSLLLDQIVGEHTADIDDKPKGNDQAY